MQTQRDIVNFTTRLSRTEYVFRRFRPYLKGKVLDVGCFEAPLRALLAGESYLGIDVAGNPDRQVNLEACDRLPFADGEFDCVVCIEVLEHLENLHAIFHELFRVSRRYVLVSLPNSWCTTRPKIDQGLGDLPKYGLPLEKPVDRHKWFLNVSQATAFFAAKATGGIALESLVLAEKPRGHVARFVRHLRFPGERYDNRYAHTVFAVFRKGAGETRPCASGS